MELTEQLPLHGRLSLVVVDAEGHEVDRRTGSNIVCTSGYSAIAAALVWSGIQDQATNIGVTSPTFLTPLWGAVGSGSGTVAKSDVQLFTELSRQQVQAGASSPASSSIAAQATWLFFFPQPPVSWSVTEAGVFANADSVINNGTMLDHQLFSPAVTVSTANALILQASFSLGP